jgi:hypothetical protein
VIQSVSEGGLQPLTLTPPDPSGSTSNQPDQAKRTQYSQRQSPGVHPDSDAPPPSATNASTRTARTSPFLRADSVTPSGPQQVRGRPTSPDPQWRVEPWRLGLSYAATILNRVESISTLIYGVWMVWEINGTDQFADWYSSLSKPEQDAVIAVVELLAEDGLEVGSEHQEKRAHAASWSHSSSGRPKRSGSSRARSSWEFQYAMRDQAV